MKRAPIRPRAPNGASEARLTLRMDRSMELDVLRAAKTEGSNVNEWVRQAIRARLLALTAP